MNSRYRSYVQEHVAEARERWVHHVDWREHRFSN